jgi:hypothetical protein
MTNPTYKKLSRRDALKILAAAAGATTLANLPPQWSKPGIAVGVLPAHAQTSVVHVKHTLDCDDNAFIQPNVEQDPITINSRVTITPPDSGIQMRYLVALDEQTGDSHQDIDSPQPPTGTVFTNGAGVAQLPVTYSNLWFGATITITWSFENPSDGDGTDQQIFSTPKPPQ